MRGKVVYYDNHRGFGVIHREGKYEDIFFHCKDVQEHEILTENDQVEFSLENRGIMAGKLALRIKRVVEEEK